MSHCYYSPSIVIANKLSLIAIELTAYFFNPSTVFSTTLNGKVKALELKLSSATGLPTLVVERLTKLITSI